MPNIEANARGSLANLLNQLGRHREAVSRYLALIPVFEGLGALDMLGHTHLNVATSYRVLGDFAKTVWHAREAERLYTVFGEMHLEATRCLMANVYLDTGELERALGLARPVLDKARRHASTYMLSDILEVMAGVQRELGDLQAARDLGEEILAMATELGNEPYELKARLSLAATALRAGKLDRHPLSDAANLLMAADP